MLSPNQGLHASIAAGTWPDISPFTTVPIIDSRLSPKLHWWQRDLLLKVSALFRAGYRRVLLQAATGAGKTVMAEAVVACALEQGLSAQFLVHRKELIRQTSRRFTSSALNHSYVAAGFPFDPSATLHLAGVQTLVRRLHLVLPPNLVIVDEAHHSTSATWAEILAAYPDAFILLLTATPERLDGKGMDEQADVMVCGPQPRWLIDNEYLSDFDYYAPSVPDLDGIDPDRQRDAAAAVMSQPKLIGDMVEHYLRHGDGGQGILFAQNRAHSRLLVDAFMANGIPTMHIDGDTPQDERDRFDDAFRAGDLRIASNVGICGEGYDVPNISYLGIGAATKSLVNHKQWCGRVLRYVKGKRATICDHAGNALPPHLGGRGLGLPDDDHEWSLVGRDARLAAKQQDWTSITQCMECFRIYPSAAPRCPGCTSERRAEPRAVKQVAGTLSKLERDAIKVATAARKKDEERACTSYDEMVSLGKARAYSFPKQWAARQCKFRRIAIPWGPQPMTSDSEEWAG